MRLLFLAALLWLCLSPRLKADYRPWLAPYDGMRETSYNRGPFIDSANKKYAYIGAPYCASAASLILDRSKAISPKIRSARAKAFIVDGSVNARLVWEGKAAVPETCLLVFTRKGGGHIEFMISKLSGTSVRVFGFNTTPNGKRGSQWNGTWSGYKVIDLKKACSPYSVFRVTHFTKVTYEQERKQPKAVQHKMGSNTNPTRLASPLRR